MRRDWILTRVALLFCFVLGFVIKIQIAHAASCGNLSTPQQWIQCYVEEARKADTDLNDAYALVAKEPDATIRNDLRYAQLKWLERRDNTCQLTDVDKSKPRWIESLKENKEKLWCIKRESEARLNEITVFSKKTLQNQSTGDICEAISESIKKDVDRLWLSARNFSSRTVRATYQSPAHDQFGHISLPNGTQLKLDVKGLEDFESFNHEVDLNFVSFEGDSNEEIHLSIYLSRSEGGLDYVFKKTGDHYTVMSGGTANDLKGAYAFFSPVYYQGRGYLVSVGAESIGTSASVKVFDAFGGKIKSRCEISVDYDRPHLTSDCADKPICNIAKNNPNLFKSDYEVWDSIPKTPANKSMPSKDEVDTTQPSISRNMSDISFNEANKTLVDIDNDGIPEIAVVIFNLPPWFEPFPTFMKKIDGKYRYVETKKQWNNFGIEDFGPGFPGRRFYVINDERRNFVAYRERLGSASTQFGKTDVLHIVLVDGNKMEQVGKITAVYPKRIDVAR